MGSIAVVQLEATAATRGTQPAVEGYDSTYVNRKLELAAYDHDRVLVCTPDHELCDPDEPLAPDTREFGMMTPGEQSRWALAVASRLVKIVRREDHETVAVYADRELRRRLKDDASLDSRLTAAGARLLEPLAGLGDRQRQTKWLGEQLSVRRSQRATPVDPQPNQSK